MVEQILDYIHNYFIKEIYDGNFHVVDGNINVDFLQDGQYYRIVGSVFNDGVHIYPSTDLKVESFKGEVWALAVPPSIISLASEIKEWVEKYNNVVNNPYQSESFGGYSYTKSNSSGSNGSGWQSVFASRLNQWRKLS